MHVLDEASIVGAVVAKLIWIHAGFNFEVAKHAGDNFSTGNTLIYKIVPNNFGDSVAGKVGGRSGAITAIWVVIKNIVSIKIIPSFFAESGGAKGWNKNKGECCENGDDFLG